MTQSNDEGFCKCNPVIGRLIPFFVFGKVAIPLRNVGLLSPLQNAVLLVSD